MTASIYSHRRNFGSDWMSDFPEFIPEYEEWMKLGKCAGRPDVFIPSGRGNNIQRIQLAKSICRECQVRDDCLKFAVKLSPKAPGVYAGFTEHELRPLRLRTPLT